MKLVFDVKVNSLIIVLSMVSGVKTWAVILTNFSVKKNAYERTEVGL